LTGDGCKQEKMKTGKQKMYFYSLLAPRQKLFFFFGHTRGSKKSNVKNKRQFFLSLSILTGSLPSVLGWLVAIFCVYVCLSWLTTDEQETIQQENSTLLEGRKRHEILPSDGRLCMFHLATHDRNSAPHSYIYSFFFYFSFYKWRNVMRRLNVAYHFHGDIKWSFASPPCATPGRFGKTGNPNI
jgi:hypothetical protein